MALLDGDLRHARQRLAVVLHGHGVADDEYLGEIGNPAVVQNFDAARAIDLDAEPFAGGRGTDAGRPDHVVGGDPGARDDHALGVDRFDLLALPNLNA